MINSPLGSQKAVANKTAFNLYGLLDRISSPHPSIQELERRRRARLISSILVVLVLTGIAGILLSFLLRLTWPTLPISILGGLLMVVVYGLSRTRYYQVAAIITIVIVSGSVVAAAILDGHPELLFFLVWCVMLGSLYLPPRTMIIASAASVAIILLLPWAGSGFPFSVTLINVAFLVGMTGSLATVAASMQWQDIWIIEQQSRELGVQLSELKRGQEALRLSESRLKLYFERMPIACIVWDDQFRVVSWNPAAETIFGYSQHEALGKRTYDLIVPEYVKPYLEKIWKRLIRGEETAQKTNENLTKDGRIILCEWSDTPLKNVAGKIIGVLSMAQDITERRKAALALSASETRYRELFHRIPATLYRTSIQGKILDANPALVDLLGYPNRETLLGKPVSEIFERPDDRIQERNLLEKEGVVHGYQLHLRKYDGQAIWVRDTSRLVKGEDGTEYYEGSLEDITDQVQAEEEIRQNTVRSQALSEISQSIVEVGLNYNMILDVVTQRVTALIGDASFILLHKNKGNQLVLASLYHPRSEMMSVLQEIITSSEQGGETGFPALGTPTSRPVLIDEISQDRIYTAILPGVGPLPESYGLYCLLYVPLRAQDRIIGTLGVVRVQPGRSYRSEDQTFLQEIADRTALAIANAQLFERAQHSLNKVEALRQIDIAITGSMDLKVSLGTILDQVMVQTGVDSANVLVFNTHSFTLDYAAGRGFRTKALQNTHLRLGEGYASRAAIEQKVLNIPDLRNRKTDLLRSPTFQEEGFVAYYAVPLVALGQIKGVLEIFHRSPLNPDAEWLDFLEALAGQAAIAIDSVGLFNDLQRSNQELITAYDSTIEGWSHALDLRDKETEGHTQRVTETTLWLSRAVGMNEAELMHVRRGALLHDIGKMGIPDQILLKHGPLTEDEWVVMRKHPVYAYEMLSPIPYLKPALDIPYCHHEKWDGTGYPRGLKGEQIPHAARLFAIVDVWDALMSDRPYRNAWPKEKVRNYIQEQAGIHFDPGVVDAFLSLTIT